MNRVMTHGVACDWPQPIRRLERLLELNSERSARRVIRDASKLIT